LGGLKRRQVLRRVRDWPAESPGAANAWLLLITTKPPSWRDPLILWPEAPPTLGVAHHGFWYPDPLGFWDEIRRWATILVGLVEAGVTSPDALAVTALFHIGEQPDRLQWALSRLQPKVLLFLDEASLATGGLDYEAVAFSIPDPHRAGVEYEGHWGRTAQGLIVGKAPQHPAAHQFYRKPDMDTYLLAAPI
jgi:hypothetical protein